ncbi:MAG: DinB family protein [Saprospiraceae bacterium]
MLQPTAIIDQLSQHEKLFQNLLQNQAAELYQWKAAPTRWSLLEIVCHLYDEEIEDFRSRVEICLTNPNATLPSIDPEAWVKDRNYAQQDYATILAKFLSARVENVNWLRQVKSANWENASQHPIFGPRSAAFFLSNWLAHDYLHIRQILSVKHGYLAEKSEQDLSYAGNW